MWRFGRLGREATRAHTNQPGQDQVTTRSKPCQRMEAEETGVSLLGMRAPANVRDVAGREIEGYASHGADRNRYRPGDHCPILHIFKAWSASCRMNQPSKGVVPKGGSAGYAKPKIGSRAWAESILAKARMKMNQKGGGLRTHKACG